jgi:hypothetical protein
MLITTLAILGGIAGFIQLSRGNNVLGTFAVLTSTAALVVNSLV